MLKAFAAVMKTLVVLCVFAMVWMASGLYHEREFSRLADEAVSVRVRAECSRPAWVRSQQDAREYDLTVREIDLVNQKLGFLGKRADDMIQKAERLEELKRETLTRSRVGDGSGGMGGPTPAARK